MRLPPLPKRVMTAAGWVPVRLVKGLTRGVKDEELLGLAEYRPRRISIEKSMPREQQWEVFYHELMHMTLYDSGLANLFKTKKKEAICDATANARMRERFGFQAAPKDSST
jgi:hypothetical protein